MCIRDSASAVQTVGGVFGPIIPPSILMVLYAVAAGTSVGDMLLAGLLPGLFLGPVSYTHLDAMTIETDTGVKTVEVYTTNGKVTSATVDMGYATLDTTALHLNPVSYTHLGR